MKRIFSHIIAMLLAISCVNLSAYAAETELSEADQLTEKACAAFPEYESIIRGEGAVSRASSYSTEPPSVVIKETRPISETEQITYFGYSDGTAIIAATAGTFSYTTSDGSYEIIPGGTSNTITITVKSSESTGTLKIKNIKYSLYQSTYDRITSTGTIELNSNCRYSTSSTKQYEDSSGDAYIRISNAQFKIVNYDNWGLSKVVDIIFYVGQNRMSVDLNNYE